MLVLGRYTAVLSVDKLCCMLFVQQQHQHAYLTRVAKGQSLLGRHESSAFRPRVNYIRQRQSTHEVPSCAVELTQPCCPLNSPLPVPSCEPPRQNMMRQTLTETSNSEPASRAERDSASSEAATVRTDGPHGRSEGMSAGTSLRTAKSVNTTNRPIRAWNDIMSLSVSKT